MTWATSSWYDAKILDWLDARVLEVFALRESAPDRFGFVGVSSADVALDNTDGAVSAAATDLIGSKIEVRHVIRYEQSSRSAIATTELVRSLRVSSLRIEPSRVTLRCVDPVDTALETLYPSGLWSADQWPDLYPDHEGQVIAEVSGTGVGVNCVYLGEIEVDDEPRWRYGVCAVRPLQTLNVATILRAERQAATYDAGSDEFVDSRGRTLAYPVTITVSGVDHYCLDFVLDQTQYGAGSSHVISAIVDSTGEGVPGRDRNPAWEAGRLLTWAGIEIDTVSFEAAEFVCQTEGLFIDYAYREQRRIDALLDELLYIARATLYTLPDGKMAMNQDTPVAIDVNTPYYDIGAGDAAEFESIDREEIPQSVELKYKPWFVNPEFASVNRDGYGGTLTRSLADGTAPPVRLRDLDMVRHWDVADRIASYWEGQYAISDNGRARVQIPIINDSPTFLAVNDVIGLANTGMYPNARYWRVVGVETGANEQSLDLRLYSDAVYGYSPSTEPREINPVIKDADDAYPWHGEWDDDREQPYARGSIVRDDAYLMVANRQTTDKPAPQPYGGREWVFGIYDNPTMAQVSENENYIVRGMRVTMPEAGFVGGVGVLLPSDDANQLYELWFVLNPLSSTDRKPSFIAAFDGSVADGPISLVRGLSILPAGTVFDVLLTMTRNDLVETTFGAEWQYEHKNGTADSEKIRHHSGGGSMSIHFQPKSGPNQGANLQTLEPGDTITAGGQTWTIQEILTIRGSSIDVSVSPSVRISEDEYDFLFTQFQPAPIEFLRDSGYWSSDPDVTGLRGDSLRGVIETDTAFGVDVEIQRAIISEEWDFMTMTSL